MSAPGSGKGSGQQELPFLTHNIEHTLSCAFQKGGGAESSVRVSLAPPPTDCMTWVSDSLCLGCLHLNNGIIKAWDFCEAEI